MSTIQDLADWVDLHPDDHEQRWWLAKKLYKNSEYEPALEHLLVLKTRWQPRLNVIRYLAATYYRLGKYPEAIAELEQGAEDWPDEIPVREQLARVLEVAGRKEGAAKIWGEIAKIKPGHTIAEQALARLPKPTPPPSQIKKLHDEDLGINFGSGQTCLSCGALNTEEHDHCWKCSASLFETPSTSSSEYRTPKPRLLTSSDSALDPGAVNTAVIWNVVGTIMICIMLAVAMFITLRQWSYTYKVSVPLTVQNFYLCELLVTRVAIGLALLVGWPIALWVALIVCRVGNFSIRPILISGVLLSTLAYATLSLPLAYLGFMLTLVLAISLVPILLLFNIDPARSLAVWAVQVVLVCSIGLIAFGALEGPSAIQEFSIMMRYAKVHDTSPKPGTTVVPNVQLPAQIPVRWEPSGSLWFDGRAGMAEFFFGNATTSKSIHVTLIDEYGVKAHDETTGVPFRFKVKIAPGRGYTLNVEGTQDATVETFINGVITPKFTR